MSGTGRPPVLRGHGSSLLVAGLGSAFGVGEIPVDSGLRIALVKVAKVPADLFRSGRACLGCHRHWPILKMSAAAATRSRSP